MMKAIFHSLINAIAVFLTAYILPGTHVDSFVTAIIVALLLAVVNIAIKPILFVLTLPVTILTLGLFTFVINALMILLVDYLVRGFWVDGFLWALAFSLVLSLISGALHTLTRK